jgi:hypothetical protein
MVVMAENEFFEFHEDSFHEFLNSWLGPEERSEEEFSVSFAAYHALAHAGMLLRARGSEEIPESLAALANAQRIKIVSDACEFVLGFGVPAHLTGILANDAPDADEVEEFEHVLLQRDELDVVIELGKRLVGDAVQRDDILLKKLSYSISIAAKFDDVFLKRPDLMAVCSRILLEWDEEIAADDMMSLFKAQGRPKRDLQVHVLNHHANVRVFRREAQPLQMAAASSLQGIVLKSAEKDELSLIPHPDEQLTTLRLVPPIATDRTILLIDHEPVELVEPWDADGEAIIRTFPIRPVLERGAELELRPE